jgi:tRNA-specific 2-thiouridylase
MPIGNITKEKVREIARRLELPVASKPQSQEICFIPDDDYCSFIKEYVPDAAAPGPILDETGKALGRHQGIIHHTIGQRKGLGIAAAEPLYVIAIDPVRNAIIVGPKERAFSDELIAAELNWIAIDKPTYPIITHARIRYRHPEAEAVITPLDETSVEVKFTQPQMAITPGQAVVFYDGEVVVGGGTIST